MDKSLTKRQKEFLSMSGQGFLHGQIAFKYKVSVNTVRNTLSKAKDRIGATTITQAIVLAIAREEIGLTHDGLTFVPDKNI